jgi:TonB family protein
MIAKIQPDIIHAQGTERWCASTVALLPYPKVITIHGFLRMIDPLMKMRPRAYWKTQTILERFSIPRYDGVVSITSYTASNVRDLTPKTWIIPNATEEKYFSIPWKPVQPPILLYVGVIQERKNQVGFIDAVAPLAQQHSFRVRICGNIDPADPYTQELMERISRYDWVESAGKVTREQLSAELAAASQSRADQSELARYTAAILREVSSNFVAPDIKSGLKCTLLVRMIPGGEVVDARVVKSSGNSTFDRQAELAVRKASPLPVPDDPRLFQQMKDIQFEFDPSELN